jgi:hypothetical protein
MSVNALIDATELVGLLSRHSPLTTSPPFTGH